MWCESLEAWWLEKCSWAEGTVRGGLSSNGGGPVRSMTNLMLGGFCCVMQLQYNNTITSEAARVLKTAVGNGQLHQVCGRQPP